MQRLQIKDLYSGAEKFSEKEVSVCGWVKTLRDSKMFGFIELNDGSCFSSCQIVFEEGKIDNFKQISKLNVGASIFVEGILILTPEMKQPFEVKAKKIEVLGSSVPEYPLQKKRHSFEFLREIAHLRPRTNTFSAVFRVRSAAAFAIHKFFNERNFIYVHTPIITASDCEGAGEMFRVTTLDPKTPPLTDSGAVDFSEDFFGKQTNFFSCGKIQYCAPRGGILDDRARDCFC